MNVSVGQHNWNTLQGTINAGGTLTGEIDLQGYTHIGLMTATNMTAGTLSFEVANQSLASGGVYASLKDGSGVDVQIPGSDVFALSGEVMKVLAPYRYVRIKTSSAQTSGLLLKLPVKA